MAAQSESPGPENEPDPGDKEVERVERGDEDEPGSMAEEVQRAAEREDQAAEG
jgi:hypothetical protein